jgi:general secretion pathway protein D
VLGVAPPIRAESPTTGTMVVATPAAPAPEPGNRRLSFNFKGVPIDTVLDHLSRAGGFAIVRNVRVEGTVDVVSHQPLGEEDAINLVVTILHEKGYAAIRAGRTLTIVNRDDARQRNLPVRQGSDPARIPANDEMVTQIIPVRYSSAKDLVENLRPLLPSYSSITSNEGANSIILTDTQANIRRVAEIITALDQSLAEISELRVFTMRYGDAKETAALITSLYAQPTSGSQNQRPAFLPPFAGGFGGGVAGGNNESRGGRGGPTTATAESAAIQASSRVVAVADERTNSVIVSGAANLLASIEQLIKTIDRSTDVLTEVRVFPLQYASATEMVEVVRGIFSPTTSTTGTRTTNNNNNTGGFARFFGGDQARGSNQGDRGGSTTTPSARAQAESSVQVVADARTNSIVVSAAPEVMARVVDVVRDLDKNPARTKKVYVYTLRNADPEEVATMLQEIFGGGTSTNRNTTTNRTGTTTDRTNTAGTTANRTNNTGNTTNRTNNR